MFCCWSVLQKPKSDFAQRDVVQMTQSQTFSIFKPSSVDSGSVCRRVVLDEDRVFFCDRDSAVKHADRLMFNDNVGHFGVSAHVISSMLEVEENVSIDGFV